MRCMVTANQPVMVVARPRPCWWAGSAGSPGRPACEGSWPRSPGRRRASTGPGPSPGSCCRASAWAPCSDGPNTSAPPVAAEAGAGSPIATAVLGHRAQPTARPVVDLPGRGGRRRHWRPAVRHARRVRVVRQRATLGTDPQRRRGPDRHPHLGADGDLLRRTRPRAGHPAGRLGRRLLLVVPGRPDARLRHPTSSGHANRKLPVADGTRSRQAWGARGRQLSP
jgi:hypothetical protein